MGDGAILTGLKSTLAQLENGRIVLSAAECRDIAKTETPACQACFETKTTGGKYINFHVLKRIVQCGAAVAAIQRSAGAHSETVGTGFLVRGADFGPGLAEDKSYVLTNAHVLWDQELGQGRENTALSPREAWIVFESDHIDGRRETYRCARVVWQSPSSLHDATLIELDRRVDHITPLVLAGRDLPLVPESQQAADRGKVHNGRAGKGTSLAVIGHPNGGALTVSLHGSIEETHATLVDKGPQGNAQEPVYLHYRTPTEPGSSGSPVFEVEDWRVVGLHHAGFDSTRGRPRLGGKPGHNFANEGIWIESIRSAVRGHLKEEQRKSRPRWFAKAAG